MPLLHRPVDAERAAVIAPAPLLLAGSDMNILGRVLTIALGVHIMDLSKLKELEDSVRKAQEQLEAKRMEVAQQIGLHALDIGASDLPPEILTGALVAAVQAHKAGGVQAAEFTRLGTDFRQRPRRPQRPRQSSAEAGSGAAPIAAAGGAGTSEAASHVGSSAEG